MSTVATTTLTMPPQTEIIDIRSAQHDLSLKKQLLTDLSGDAPRFPSLLLWDEQGLREFEAVTYTDEYYPTASEMELLKRHSHTIAQYITPGTVLVELGSGCLRKTKILLEALDKAKRWVDYYALDLDRNELERSLLELAPGASGYVRCHGLHRTYDDGLQWLQRQEVASRPRTVMSLGSTLGSMTPSQTARFLKSFSQALEKRVNGAQNIMPLMIIGLDGCTAGEKVWAAYNDSRGVNDRFVKNVLNHANVLLGSTVFQQDDWIRQGEWNEKLHRHEQYLCPRRGVDFKNVHLHRNQKIFVVASQKYSRGEVEELWRKCLLQQVRGWQTPDQYGLYLLSTSQAL